MANVTPVEMFSQDRLFSADGSFNKGVLSLGSSEPGNRWFGSRTSIATPAEMEMGCMNILQFMKDEMNRFFMSDVLNDPRVDRTVTNRQRDVLAIMRSYLAGERVKDILSSRRDLRSYSGELASHQKWAEHVGWFFQSNAARQNYCPVQFNNDEIFEILTGPDVVTLVVDAFPELKFVTVYSTVLDEKTVRFGLTKNPDRICFDFESR